MSATSTFELQLRDSSIVYYGPHPCDVCGVTIVRMGEEWGGTRVDLPGGPIYPNSEWRLHVCASERASEPAKDVATDAEPQPSALKATSAKRTNDSCGVEYCVYEIRGSVFRRLLGKALDILSLSLPNKQQHQAAMHTMRKAFDEAYYDMLRQTFPNGEFGTDAAYSVDPLR